MSIKEMNQEVALEWLTALESGEYTQDDNKLKSKDGFCCLGVLCDIHAKKTNGVWTNNSNDPYNRSNFYLGERDYLPLEVAAWAGLNLDEKSEIGSYLNPCLSSGKPVSHLNDLDHKSFAEIASLIREDVFGKGSANGLA